jgi:hypothetical protein
MLAEDDLTSEPTPAQHVKVLQGLSEDSNDDQDEENVESDIDENAESDGDLLDEVELVAFTDIHRCDSSLSDVDEY